MSVNAKKIVVVGDGWCGKTSIVRMFYERKFPNSPERTIFDTFYLEVYYEGRPVPLMIWDSSGQEEWAHIRQQTYHASDAVLLVFDLSERKTFNNIFVEWITEIREFCPKVPIILVGNKSDLRTDNARFCVTYQEGLKVSETIGAAAYIECSALTGHGVDELFTKAAEIMKRKTFIIF